MENDKSSQVVIFQSLVRRDSSINASLSKPIAESENIPENATGEFPALASNVIELFKRKASTAKPVHPMDLSKEDTDRARRQLLTELHEFGC